MNITNTWYVYDYEVTTHEANVRRRRVDNTFRKSRRRCRLLAGDFFALRFRNIACEIFDL